MPGGGQLHDGLDPDRVAAVGDAALGAAARLGASHATVRVERIRSQAVALRDGRVETTVDDTELGVGLRVVHRGAPGFAATVAIGTDAAAALATSAVEVARLTSLAGRRPLELADEPSHGTLRWSSPYRRDPTEVPLADKVALLEGWSHRLLGAPGIAHVTAQVLAVGEDKYLADLSGTVAVQRRVRIHPVVGAMAVADDGDFEEMRTLAPPAG
ncbi:MAG: PmbA/TldA family metallopeptidase, partial [Acidimicrobiales bacterium]